MKLIVLDGHALNPGDLSYDCLNRFGDVTVYDRTDSEAEAIARIGDSEIVLVNKVPITESLLAACPNIRLICVQATGYNVVDCAACTKRRLPSGCGGRPAYGILHRRAVQNDSESGITTRRCPGAGRA